MIQYMPETINKSQKNADQNISKLTKLQTQSEESDMRENWVKTLSDYKLTDAERRVLSKGMKFVVTSNSRFVNKPKIVARSRSGNTTATTIRS